MISTIRDATFQDEDFVLSCINALPSDLVSMCIANNQVQIAVDSEQRRVGFFSMVSSDVTPFIPRGGSNWWNAFDYIRFLYVCDTNRRAGVGAQLLQRALSSSKMRFVHVGLLENNVDSHQLFIDAGFSRMAYCLERSIINTMISSSSSTQQQQQNETQNNNIRFRPITMELDRLLVRDGLRAIFDAEGRLETYLDGVEEEELLFFAEHYAASTIVAVDEATNKSLGWLAFSITDRFPFGVDFGKYKNGEEYLFVSYVYVTAEGRRFVCLILVL